jgi:branched-chain amino acid transport system ATP-binding protein
MAIVPENRRLFAPMSVLENLQMGAYLHNGGSKEDFERVYSLFPLLYERRSQLARHCPAASSRWSRWGAR